MLPNDLDILRESFALQCFKIAWPIYLPFIIELSVGLPQIEVASRFLFHDGNRLMIYAGIFELTYFLCAFGFVILWAWELIRKTSEAT